MRRLWLGPEGLCVCVRRWMELYGAGAADDVLQPGRRPGRHCPRCSARCRAQPHAKSRLLCGLRPYDGASSCGWAQGKGGTGEQGVMWGGAGRRGHLTTGFWCPLLVASASPGGCWRPCATGGGGGWTSPQAFARPVRGASVCEGELPGTHVQAPRVGLRSASESPSRRRCCGCCGGGGGGSGWEGAAGLVNVTLPTPSQGADQAKG